MKPFTFSMSKYVLDEMDRILKYGLKFSDLHFQSVI